MIAPVARLATTSSPICNLDLDPAMVARPPFLRRVESAYLQRPSEFCRSEDVVQLAPCRGRRLPVGMKGRDVRAVPGELVRPGICLPAVGVFRPDAGQAHDLHPIEDRPVAGSPVIVAVLAVTAEDVHVTGGQHAVSVRLRDERRQVGDNVMRGAKQRNTRDEKQAIRAGKTAPEIWPEQPAKARQKHVDARWTIQTGKARPDPERKALLDIAIPTFGYKAHTSIDRRYRLIRCWDVTDASRHDGWLLRQGLLDPTNTGAGVWADTAYRSQQNETFLERHGFISHIHRRRRLGRPLPAHIRRGNARRSRDRAPVEHVLAVQKQAMRLVIRTIGLARARTKIGMANLAFNIRRLVQLRGRVPA